MRNGENKVNAVFPYLRVKDAPSAIAFYKEIFGARERFRLTEPDGRIGHIEFDLGGSILMVSEEYPEYGILGPQQPGTTGMAIHLHVDNADELAGRAVAAGATMMRPLADHFYGERSCLIRDPFGHEWMLGHEIEQVAPDEMQRRYSAMFD